MSETDKDFYLTAWRCLISFVIAFAKWKGFYLSIETKRGEKKIIDS